MTYFPQSPTDARRLQALRSYAVLDSPQREALDEITALAALVCQTPGALISLIDEDRQWFMSRVGVDLTETPLDLSFCKYALGQPGLLIVPDTTQDARFAHNPLVTGPPGIRFYAGAPLVTPDGDGLGTLCVIDCVARTLTAEQEQVLRVLGRQVMAHLELHRQRREWKASEGKLRASEQLFASAFEYAAVGVALVAPDGRFLKVNRALERMLNYSAAELRSLTFQQVTHPDDLLLDLKNVQRLLASEIDSFQIEKRYLPKHGEVVSAILSVSLVRDEAGQPLHFISQIQDITERKDLELQFRRAQRMESIGTLAGGIAHDLNNSLAPIMMSLELLTARFTDPESAELLEIVSDCARHGSAMVRQILSFARGVEGERQEVQLRHLIRDVERIISDTFPKNIRVTTRVPNDLWTVLGDPTQFQQVLLNLCINARNALPDGGSLTIVAENVVPDIHRTEQKSPPEAPTEPYVSLRVSDTGTGILPTNMGRIFDPFFTTKDVAQSTGLGLSTSLAIVKSHGGFIQVESEFGKGTTLEVHLPALRGSPAETAEKTAGEIPRGHGELILVVDDELAVRQVTDRALKAFGYRVILAGDGVEALAIYDREHREIAAVLIDMMMPRMDGPTMVQALHRLNPQLPIIAASGLAVHEAVALLGVEQFLSKPYRVEPLLKALHSVLSDRRIEHRR